eukprot:c20391_g1_i2.p1 GENE.c20391_g1_i2~~c20391_g1_i2.p1  ORF type:complete len:438 (+),score=146.04 c20391_g1_i2:40-1314(+)
MKSDSLQTQLVEISKKLIKKKLSITQRFDFHTTKKDEMETFSIFDSVPKSSKIGVVNDSLTNIQINRSVGCFVGGAIGDSIGAPLEFLHVIDKPESSGSFFEIKNGEISYHNAWNKFQLKHGQWTDDTAMALCIADSLILNQQYNGSDIRVRFYNWWFRGYNNAFRKDETRTGSVGLGGNISQSLFSLKEGETPTPRYQSQAQDAGNGSIMRLAPIPILYHKDIEKAREMAVEQSFTTHPGLIAAEAAKFMSHIIVRAITSEQSQLNAKEFLDSVANEYLSLISNDTTPAILLLKKLILSEEPSGSKERCWNWKHDSLNFSETLVSRGKQYNGYPVSPTYFGSYCMDGLAMGLHAVYHSTSFENAVTRAVNLLGDADTIGSIAGQIAGAIYGYTSINQIFIKNLNQWDDGEIALRAVMLYHQGE